MDEIQVDLRQSNMKRRLYFPVIKIVSNFKLLRRKIGGIVKRVAKARFKTH